MELKVDEDQMRFGFFFFFFAGSILEQANGLRVKRGEEVVDKRDKVNSERQAPEVAEPWGHLF